MKKILFAFLLALTISTSSFATNAGEYTLRMLAGPSFNTNDWVDQFKFGGEFNYDVGYSMNISLLSTFGVGGDEFKFNLIPGFGYNFLYLGPAAIHALAGIGYAAYNSNSAMDVRLSTGISLPLGDFWEAYSDINYIFSPVGISGTPATFDWMLGFGFVFK